MNETVSRDIRKGFQFFLLLVKTNRKIEGTTKKKPLFLHRLTSKAAIVNIAISFFLILFLLKISHEMTMHSVVNQAKKAMNKASL